MYFFQACMSWVICDVYPDTVQRYCQLFRLVQLNLWPCKLKKRGWNEIHKWPRIAFIIKPCLDIIVINLLADSRVNTAKTKESTGLVWSGFKGWMYDYRMVEVGPAAIYKSSEMLYNVILTFLAFWQAEIIQLPYWRQVTRFGKTSKSMETVLYGELFNKYEPDIDFTAISHVTRFAGSLFLPSSSNTARSCLFNKQLSYLDDIYLKLHFFLGAHIWCITRNINLSLYLGVLIWRLTILLYIHVALPRCTYLSRTIYPGVYIWCLTILLYIHVALPRCTYLLRTIYLSVHIWRLTILLHIHVALPRCIYLMHNNSHRCTYLMLNNIVTYTCCLTTVHAQQFTSVYIFDA